MIGNQSGCSRLVLWQDDVGKLKEDHNYKVVGARVHTLKGMNYLSLGKQPHIDHIDGTADVEETTYRNVV